MEFSYDRWNQLEDIELILCNPNKQKIGVISAVERKVTLRLNDLAELTFDVPRYAANARGEVVDSPYYDWVQTMRLIFADQIGWFVITKVEESDAEDGAITKSVTCESAQTTFKNFGFVTEERVYKFYDPKDEIDYNYDSNDLSSMPSIVGQLYQQLCIRIRLKKDADGNVVDTDDGEDNEDWTLTYVTPSLWFDQDVADLEDEDDPLYGTNVCRTLTDNTTNGYDFMLNDVEDAFEILFCFDYLLHTIKVKTADEITKKTNIYLSKDNILNSLQVEENASDIATVLSCEGDSLDITLVNPMGTNYIVNFDYYMQEATDKNGNPYYPWMSLELISAIKAWKDVYDACKPYYQEEVLKLRDLYEDQLYIEERLTYLKTKLSDVQAVFDQVNDPDNELVGNEIFIAEEVQAGETSIYPKSLFYDEEFYSDLEVDDDGNVIRTNKNEVYDFYPEIALAEDERSLIGDNEPSPVITYNKTNLSLSDFTAKGTIIDGNERGMQIRLTVNYNGSSPLEYETAVSVYYEYLDHGEAINDTYSLWIDAGETYADVTMTFYGNFQIDYVADSASVVSASQDVPVITYETTETSVQTDEGVGKYTISGEPDCHAYSEAVDPASGEIEYPYFIESCGSLIYDESYKVTLSDMETYFAPSDTCIEDAGYTVSVVPIEDEETDDEDEEDDHNSSCEITVTRKGSVDDEDVQKTFIIATVRYGYWCTDVMNSNTLKRATKTVSVKIPQGELSASVRKDWNTYVYAKNPDAIYSAGISEIKKYQAVEKEIRYDDEGNPIEYYGLYEGETYCELYSEVASVEATVDTSEYEIVSTEFGEHEEGGVFGNDNFNYYTQTMVVTIRLKDVDDEGNEIEDKDCDVLLTYRAGVKVATVYNGNPITTVRTFTESAFLPKGEREVQITITGLVGMEAQNGYSAITPEVDTEELSDVITTVYQLAGFYRYACYENAYFWMGLYNDEIARIQQDYDAIQNEIDLIAGNGLEGDEKIVGTLEQISSKAAILSYFEQNCKHLVPELRAYWKESTYTNDNLAVLDTTTMAEQIDLANQLMEAGEDELSLISQPRFSFTAEGINFIFLPEFRPFAKEVEMGCVVTVEKEEGVFYYPSLSQVEFSLDDFSSFSMTFTNRARLDDFGYTIADLISSSSSTSNTINNNWSNLMKYVNQEDELEKIITNPLEETFTMAKNNAVLQEFSWNETGFWGRKLISKDQPGYYYPEQLRMTNNILMFTDDDWGSIKTAIGKVSVDGEEYYGVIGDVIVGNLIFGQQMHIVNDTNTITMDSKGLTIYDNTDNEVFYADTDGNLVLKGALMANSTIQQTTIEGAKIYECTIDEKSTFSGNFSGTIVNSDGATLAYIENGKLYLTEGTSLKGTEIVNSEGERVGYIGDDGTAYILVAAQEGSSITGATIAECVIDSDSTFSGNIVAEDGTIIATITDGKLSVIADLSEDSELSGQIVAEDGSVVGGIKDGQLWAIITDSTIESSTVVGSTVEETKVYESSVSLDEYGLTIVNSGGITIYSSKYQDAREAVFDEITQSDGTKKRVLYADKDKTEVIDPVFYADDEGNLVLKGVIHASAGEFTGKIIASDGQIAGFAITDEYLTKDKIEYDDDIPGVYVGTKGIGVTGEKENGENSGFYISSEGDVSGVGCSFVDASISGSGTFSGIAADSISVDSADIKTARFSGSVNVSGTLSASAITVGGSEITSSVASGGFIYAEASASYRKGTSYCYLRATVNIKFEDAATGERKDYAYASGNDKTFTVKVYYTKKGGAETKTLSVTVNGGSSSGTSEEFKAGVQRYSYSIDGCEFPSSGEDTMFLEIVMASGTVPSTYFNGHLLPTNGTSGAQNIGSTNGYLWNQIYASNTQISSSDGNLKNSIEGVPDEYSLFFDNLNPVRYKMNSGTSNRYHTGLIAQQVFQALNDSGLTSYDFAGYINDPQSSFYGLRYEEFIALLIKEVQDLKKKVNALENAEGGASK